MPCIIDGNKIIDTPIKNILDLVKSQADVIGNGKLKHIEYKQSEALVTCPSHKDGRENRPSCGVLLIDKGDIPAGTAHCFACGYRARLNKFVADCLDISYGQATRWLLSSVRYSFIENQRNVDFIDFDTATPSEHAVVSSEELVKYEYIHPYMFQRKLSPEVIRKYEVGYDPSTNCLTFPVYVDGECVLVARRKVNSKKFIMPNITPKPIYGLDYIKSDDDVIICESVINALTAISYGYTAVALFGTGSEYQLNLLKDSNIRSFTLCFDGDAAGYNAERRFRKYMGNSKLIKTMHLPFGKDANDINKEDFDKLYSNASYI